MSEGILNHFICLGKHSCITEKGCRESKPTKLVGNVDYKGKNKTWNKKDFNLWFSCIDFDITKKRTVLCESNNVKSPVVNRSLRIWKS